nr:hypothetical protein [Tanacetum cinerariifolium]
MMSSLFITNNFKKVMNEGGVVTEENEAIELQPQKKGTKLSDFMARKKDTTTSCIPTILLLSHILDIYGDHVVSCAEIIGIEHCPNVVRDTFVDICYHSGISAGNEVDIGLDGGRGKPLRLTDMLLYSWNGRLDVCVDLTGSSPLTQTKMVDFLSGQAVTDAAQRKRDKYMDRCAAIEYGFLLFSFSSLGELETYTVILLKQIHNFSIS